MAMARASWIAIVLPTAVALLHQLTQEPNRPTSSAGHARELRISPLSPTATVRRMHSGDLYTSACVSCFSARSMACIDAKQVVIVAPFGRSGLAQLLPPTWADDKATHPAGVMVAGVDRMVRGAAGRSGHHRAGYLVAVRGRAPARRTPPRRCGRTRAAEFFAAGRLEESPAIRAPADATCRSCGRETNPSTSCWCATRGSPIVRERGARRSSTPRALAASPLLEARRGRTIHCSAHGVHRKGCEGRAWACGHRGLWRFAATDATASADARRERFFDARRFRRPQAPAAPASSGWRPGGRAGRLPTHDVFHLASRLLGQAADLGRPRPVQVPERQALLAIQQQQPA